MSNDKNSFKVAVYGSLKRGFGNHGLLSDSLFLYSGLTKPEYSLVSLTGFPGLIDGEDQVEIEVYSVSKETLNKLDRLEGHPTFYERIEIEVFTSSIDEPIAKAFIYKYKGSNRNVIPSKDGVVSW